MSQKTWGGRFEGGTDERVEAFSESISFDHRLYRHDIRASQAHARMLAATGLLSNEESTKIVQALDDIEKTIACGEMEFHFNLEDIHTHIERALIDKLGDTGRKLHTARSRNDQIATDIKLWVRDTIDELCEMLKQLQSAFHESAQRQCDVIIPAYTHMQRAQPVLAGHYFLAYIEKFERDRERLMDCRKRVNVLPLGTAALAGTTLPIDRDMVRQELGFDALARNSLDVSSDRDFIAELLFDLSMVAIHLSGWAEEWILWSTTEFNFLKLPDAFCTGSSIMPHKKNPDVLELTRGKTGRVIGALQNILVLLKGLPLAYNRDLQEDKIALFDAVDTVMSCLGVAIPLVQGTRLKPETIASRIEDGFLDATSLMERLIAHGVPMRSAHETVGKLVRRCENESKRLADLSMGEIREVLADAPENLQQSLGVENAIAAFQSVGSTAPAQVKQQIAEWAGRLGMQP